jgi:O-Antigen ligase
VTFDFLRRASRWLFFAALVVAPWFYGGTTAVSIVVINWVLGASLLLWVIELFVNRRLPKFPKSLFFVIATLLIVGAWMTINARSIYDAEFGVFSAIANIVPRAPGSVDYPISLAWMIRGALLLMSILFVVDLSQSERGLIQLWQVMALTAGSIALLGLLQKATNAEAIFWETPVYGYGKTFFASYYYHANAGAFLNLTLPFTTGLAVRTFGTPSSQLTRSLWLLMFLLNLAAIASNTSRGAQLVAGIILIGILWVLMPRVFRGLSRGEKNVALGGAAAILLVLYAIGQASHLEQPLAHWKQNEVISQDARWLAAQTAIKALPKAGLFGYGPGTFRVVFPRLNADANNLAGTGTWRFLHEDYLQTVIEWGWAGSALWALLFVGGIAAASVSLRKQRSLRRRRESENAQRSTLNVQRSTDMREWSRRRRLILPLAIIALIGVALHAIADFPLQIESVQLYVATCLGICWGSATWQRGRPING